MFSRALLAVLGLGLVGLAALRGDPPDPGIAGTLPEDLLPSLGPILDAALHESPQMVTDALDIDIANAQKLSQGIAPMLPQAGASVYYGQNWSAIAHNLGANTATQGLYYDFNVNQKIFQWGQLKDQLAIQKLQVALQQRHFADAYEGFVNALRAQYMALIAEKLDLRNQRFLHDVTVRNLAAVQQRIKAGAASSGEIAAAQLYEAQAALNLEQADANFDFDRKQFARQLGRKDFPADQVPDTIPAPTYNPAAAQALLADLLSTGARYTPQAQEALLQIKQQDYALRKIKVQQRPMISMGGDINQQNQTNATPQAVQLTAVTNESYYIRADIDVFDGFRTRGQRREAQLERRKQEEQLAITADQLMDQAQRAERSVKFAWDGLKIAEQQYELAALALKTSEGDLRRGVGSQDAVDTNRANAESMESNLIRSRAHFLTVWSDFVNQVGHDPAIDRLPARYVRPVN